jgi:predicted PurR-regulated permease PerM
MPVQTERPPSRSHLLLPAAIVIAFCYWAKVVLIVALASLTVAILLEPVVRVLLRLHLPRGLASLVAVAALLAAIYGAAFLFYSRAAAFVSELPSYSGEIRDLMQRLRRHAERLRESTESVLPGAVDDGTPIIRPIQPPIWSTLVRTLGPVSEVLVAASFIPFLAYFMLSWQPHLRRTTVMLFPPMRRSDAEVSLTLVVRMFRRFIAGNLVTALIVGTVSTVVFGMLKLPFFYFVGFMSAFLGLFPYLGLLLAPLVPLTVGIGRLSTTGAAIVLATTAALHLLALNVLYPKLVGNSVQLNPFAATLALLLWGWLWGPIGLLLAIPITAGLKIIFDQSESTRPIGAWLGLGNA